MGEGALGLQGQEIREMKDPRCVKNPLRDKRIHRTTIEEEVRLFDYECLIRKLQVQLKTARKDAFILRKRIQYRRQKEKEREATTCASDSNPNGGGEVVSVGLPGDY